MSWLNEGRRSVAHAAREVSPNPSVKASPNSYARKARLGQSYHRPCRALRAPL
ncbi:hypothetical protein BurJ1DRAFT_1869 [Burkholderiales bacterium JOSHI_001]|nr:hypothetical protein BurJ1DRAFT_1869 [Burkholderiales bacterium JOSHI_001]